MDNNQIYKQKVLELPFCSVYVESDVPFTDFHQIPADRYRKMHPEVKDLTYISVSILPDGREHCIRCYPDDFRMTFDSYWEADERVEYRIYENQTKTAVFSIGCWGEAWPAGVTRFNNGFDYEVGCIGEGVSYLIKDRTVSSTYYFAIGWISSDETIDPGSDLYYELECAVDLTGVCFDRH